MSDRFPGQVSLHNVCRAYGRSFALHRITLELHAGSIAAIVGDNGAGKSTLLNILATIDHPTSGQITYDKMGARQFCRRARQCIGWVSHHSLLYGELSARENLLFFAKMYGIDDASSRASAWLERVGLGDDGDRRVRTFSRGMKQRLTIARALIHNPQLLLFDEPATGLDQRGNRFVTGLLDSLRTKNRIIVVVSHNFDLIDGLADRLIILRRGKVASDQAIGDSFDLLKTYRAHA